MSPFLLVPRSPLGLLVSHAMLGEAIVVGAGLSDGEGERAYIVYDPTLFLRRYSCFPDKILCWL